MTPGLHKNLWARLLSISPTEAKFDRRGFRVTESNTVRHLESAGENFLLGYHLALVTNNPSTLAAELNHIEPLHRGFAFEGAAMGLVLSDCLLPLRRRVFPAFLSEAGDLHMYMLHVGAGWAFARIPWIRRRLEKNIATYDPLLKWLVLDGYGFHEGYFYSKKYLGAGNSFGSVSGYAGRAFAQGFGRSLWFIEGADVFAISQTISGLPEQFHPDLWSGVGLACAYAGGAKQEDIRKIRSLAGPHLPHLAQGVTFAAKTRERAGNQAEHTETACRAICHCTSREAALLTDKHLENLPPETSVPRYEVWRQRIQKDFLPTGAAV